MMRSSLLGLSLRAGVTMLGLGLLLQAVPVGAQQKGGTSGSSGTADAKVILPRDGYEKLDTLYKKKETREALDSMVKGTTTPTAAHKDVIETAAKWHVYRVTWPSLQEKEDGMDGVVRDLDKRLADAGRKATTESFVKEFTKAALGCVREVLQNDRAIARVNGARLLARLAGTGQEDVLDVLTETLRDPKQNDAVKLWALRGFTTFFNLSRTEVTGRVKDEQREHNAILALLEYLTRKPSPEIEKDLKTLATKVDSPSLADEMEERNAREELAAVRYLRRDNVRALGETRYPALVGKDKKPLPNALTALALLRVLRKDGTAVEPELSEQLEAAIAVCQLNAELTPDYQADYAAALVGHFLVEFIQSCVESRGAQDKREPWKIHIVRLIQALDALKENSRKTPAAAYVNKFVGKAKPMLEGLEKNQSQQPADLDAWLSQNPPPNTSVYKGMNTSEVKTPERAG